jgi:membrane protein required for colicin V production
MSFDLAALAMVFIFAILGAFTGFARQVGQVVSAVCALAAAAPAGRFFGSPVAEAMATTLTAGVVIATVGTFIILLIVVQILVAAVIRRMMPEGPSGLGLDRFLGAMLSGTKAAAFIFIGVCAMLFLEGHLLWNGKKLGWTPPKSVVMGWAKNHNLFEQIQFSGIQKFMEVARRLTNPKLLNEVKNDPDYTALIQDPRFKQALQAEGLREALEGGDMKALFKNNQLIELIHDGKAMHRLERIADLTR